MFQLAFTACSFPAIVSNAFAANGNFAILVLVSMIQYEISLSLYFFFKFPVIIFIKFLMSQRISAFILMN